MESPNTPVRRVQRVRHELHRRDVEVVRIERPSPHFVAITFAADSLREFVSLGFDDHVKFMFDAGDGGEPVRRDYTPRSWDLARGELTLEFAVHGHGGAGNWADRATVGQRAIIGGPRGSMIVPVDYDWHLLVGDASALPAIHRRLEELPDGTRAIVVMLMPEPADRREIASRAQVELHWVASDEELLAAVRALALPPGEGFSWCAGEAGLMARLRTVLVEEKGQVKEAMKVAAYWKPGAADFHETLEA
ncbi:siderophore-interacting protein [Paucibacter sp. R3-3]|uniref:Siderophore-interacting protein n=1 Tax=Roseateles agri TaxID=3098619 RepID=A0ABU5DBC4_9BURK|nr:siderophore-interacting protein [Paucibacter sp. R3-3]MDY0743573.1 siderophore-interacting protein [Paucibacter sp. R3-3]